MADPNARAAHDLQARDPQELQARYPHDLMARYPHDGLDLPLRLGEAVLSVLDDAAMISIAPFRGREEAVSRALANQAGGGLPEIGAVGALAEGRLIWSGAGQVFLRGAVAERAELLSALEGLAAVTDQRDAWSALHLGGADAAGVLARLVPIDLEPEAFPPGAAARTLLGHLACVLTAEADGFGIGVMRSLTLTAVHELTRAMRAVAALGKLRDHVGEK